MNKTFYADASFEVKALDDEPDILRISGYANTTDKDRAGDVILSSAWEGDALTNYLDNPIILAYHDHKRPIGQMVNYSITSKGLFIEAEISKLSGEVYDLIKTGILKSFSVGFKIKDAEYDRREDTFTIKEAELMEISVVSVPANAKSTFSLAKSFDNTNELVEFKSLYAKSEAIPPQVEVTPVTVPSSTDEIKSLVEHTLEQIRGITSKQAESFDAAIKSMLINNEEPVAPKEKEVMSVEVGISGVERLVADLQAKMEAQDAKYSEVISSLKSELQDKSKEIEAVVKSKMTFQDRKISGDSLNAREKDTAVLLAKMLGKPIDSTNYFQRLRTKSNQEHFDIGGSVTAGEWETEYSTRLYNEIRNKLVVAPIFTNKMKMLTRTMVIPVNPDVSGTQTLWVDSADLRGQGDSSSGTTATDGKVKEKILSAFKLVTKETIGFDEEEDSLIPLIPIINANMARRLSKAIDTALLLGTSPFSGIATLADAAAGTTREAPVLDISDEDAFDYSRFISMREKMGFYGLTPSELFLIVNKSIYYDMVEQEVYKNAVISSTDVITNVADGSVVQATRGVVGTYGGIKVIVSDSFVTPADTVAGAVLVNPNYYLLGDYGNARTEKDRDISNQQNVLVSSLNMGFIEMEGTPSVIVKYAA
jgi:HK97 family phage prohead protease